VEARKLRSQMAVFGCFGKMANAAIDREGAAKLRTPQHAVRTFSYILDIYTIIRTAIE
jgi:hypothetical protein